MLLPSIKGFEYLSAILEDSHNRVEYFKKFEEKDTLVNNDLLTVYLSNLHLPILNSKTVLLPNHFMWSLFVTKLFPYIVRVHQSLSKRHWKRNMKIYFLVYPEDLFFSDSEKTFRLI